MSEGSTSTIGGIKIFQAGRYVVVTRGIVDDQKTNTVYFSNDMMEGHVLPNYIYMQRISHATLCPVLDSRESRKGIQRYVRADEKNVQFGLNRQATILWREPTKLEIIVYRALKKPYDVNTIGEGISLSIVPKSKSHFLYGEKLEYEDTIIDKNGKQGIYFKDQPSIYDINEFNIQVLKQE